MAVLAGFAGIMHVFESLVCIHITRNKYKMKGMTVALWAVNVFLAGIFGRYNNNTVQLYTNKTKSLIDAIYTCFRC